MENEKLSAGWDQWKAKLKEEHPHLTDEDLHYDDEDEDGLIFRIGEKIGKTTEEIREWFKSKA